MEKFRKAYPRAAKAIKYGGNALKVANQAYQMAKVVASIVNAEKKYHDYFDFISPDSAQAQMALLTEIDQGDDKINRNGDSIAVKSLQVDGTVTFDSAKPNEIIRVMIIRENENARNVAPSINNILESNGIYAFRNKDYGKRFKTLYDKTFTCDTSQLIRTFSYYKKFKMMKDNKGNPTIARHITWNTADGADTGKGHLWLVVLGNTATADTTSDVTWNSRIRFYDN